MGRIVIAAYRPKSGKQQALRQLMEEHVPKLRSLELVTDREPFIMEAEDSTVVEVFEWKSAEAIEAAHTDPVVLEMWERFSEACDFIPVAELPEASHLFSEFSPMAARDDSTTEST